MRGMTDLARIRKDILQITQVDLAAICEVAQSTVSRWERGVEEPSQSHIKRMLNWAAKEGKPLQAGHFFGAELTFQRDEDTRPHTETSPVPELREAKDPADALNDIHLKVLQDQAAGRFPTKGEAA